MINGNLTNKTIVFIKLFTYLHTTFQNNFQFFCNVLQNITRWIILKLLGIFIFISVFDFNLF